MSNVVPVHPHRKALSLAKALRERPPLAQALERLGQPGARASTRSSRLAQRAATVPAWARLLLGSLALVDDPYAALPRLAGAVAWAQASGDDELAGRALNNLAIAHGALGDLDRADALLRDALAAKGRSGADHLAVGRTLLSLAELALASDREQDAIDYATQAVSTLDHTDDPRLRASARSVLALASLAATADVVSPHASPDEGARLAAEADALLEAVGEHGSLRSIVRARRSVVLHARGLVDDARAELRRAAHGGEGGAVAYQITPVVQAHARLLAHRDPAAAASVRAYAHAIRTHPTANPLPPLATIATLLRP